MEQDHIIEKMLDDNPLILFSLYTDSQAKYLVKYGKKIIGVMDDGIGENRIMENVLPEVYGMFWLWVLGAYEVVRTMSQHAICFEKTIAADIHKVKKTLHRIRIPFAKQELPGFSRNNPNYIYDELSIHGIDDSKKDFTYKVLDREISTRDTILEFERFIHSIERRHIMGKMPLGSS